MKNLYEYLAKNMDGMHGDFTVAVTDMSDKEPGLLALTIHPTYHDGQTAEFFMHADGREEFDPGCIVGTTTEGDKLSGEGDRTTNYNRIEITLKGGHTAYWEADKGEWDDYAYDGTAIIIKKNGAWVAIYNMDSVICLIMK